MRPRPRRRPHGSFGREPPPSMPTPPTPPLPRTPTSSIPSRQIEPVPSHLGDRKEGTGPRAAASDASVGSQRCGRQIPRHGSPRRPMHARDRDQQREQHQRSIAFIPPPLRRIPLPRPSTSAPRHGYALTYTNRVTPPAGKLQDQDPVVIQRFNVSLGRIVEDAPSKFHPTVDQMPQRQGRTHQVLAPTRTVLCARPCIHLLPHS